MRKNFLTLFFVGLVGGLLGAYLFSSFIGNNYSANINEPIEPTPIVQTTPVQGFWEKIISEASLYSVGIQVFQNNKIVREGSGVVISSDGLIATTADLAISGAAYQVFYEDKILRGVPAMLDYKRNILLLKTDNPTSGVVGLKDESYRSGQEIVLIGKIISLSKPSVFSQHGFISYITDKGIVLDTVSGNRIRGAGVISAKGEFIGLTTTANNTVSVIPASSISALFDEYINKN